MQAVEMNYRMMTVIIEHEKRIKRILSARLGLSPTEFAILRSIALSGGTSTGLSTGEFLLLKHNSISVAVSHLKEMDLLDKEIDQTDRRATKLTVTQKGLEATERATHAIYDDFKITFWKNMDESDIRKAIRVGSLVNRKLASSEPLSKNSFDDTPLPISPEFIINMKVLPKLWSDTIKKTGPLSMPEYRILDLLQNSNEPLRSFDIAGKLMMDRAAVSRNKDKLEKQGFIVAQQNAKDRRDVLLSNTRSGCDLAISILGELSKLTANLYSDLDEQEARQMNAWHDEMYRGLLESS